MKNKALYLYRLFNKLIDKLWMGTPVLVLSYHRVNDVFDPNLKQLTVSISNFEKQIAFLKNNFTILRLTDSWKTKKNSVVITFDDGYADNFYNALPILEKYDIPATLFPCTKNINTDQEFWWDRLSHLYSLLPNTFFVPEKAEKVTKEAYTHYAIGAVMQLKTDVEKLDWLQKFESLNAIKITSRKEFKSLSNSEIIALSNHPLIDIGLHTHHHYNFKNLNENQQYEELKLSLLQLEKRTEKKPIRYFALPHGGFNTQTFQITKKFQLITLLLNNQYSNTKNKETGKINRILIPNLEELEFKNYINNFI